MLLELAVISALTGIALGLRFRVLVLVPAVTLAMLFAMTVGMARGDHFWSVVLAMAILGSAVQFGYLAGVVIRLAVEAISARMVEGHSPGLNSEIWRA